MTTRNENYMESRKNQEHILHFSLSARVASLMLPSLAFFAQKLVDVALRRHGAFLHCSWDIHDLLLVGLLLLRLLRLVMRHWRVVIAIHTGRRWWWLLGLLLLLLLLRLRLLGINRGVVVQRRVQREIVAAHGSSGRRDGAASQ